MPGSTCHLCRGWGDAHFHWCIAVGGPGTKTPPAPAPIALAAPAAQTPIRPGAGGPKQPTGGGEPPVGLSPAPAAASPAVRPVRACRECHQPEAAHKLDCSRRPGRQAVIRTKAAADRVAELPHRARPTVTRPEPEYPRTEAIKIAKLRDRTAEASPAVQWRYIVGDTPADWTGVSDEELGAFANRLADHCRQYGLSITYKIREDVLAVDGFDEAAVDTALRIPERVEVRPESWEKDKRYPVLAFRRGDVVVVLGLRFTDAPAVIAAYWTSLLSGYDPRVHRDRTGGGGNKMPGSTPTSVKALVKRLTAMGAYVDPEWQTTTGPVPVSYDGQDLGQITVGPHVPRATIDSDWNRTQRKIHAIDQRAGVR